MGRLRTAVIGVGIQGENHVLAYRQHPLVDLVAVCDINRARAREVAAKYGVERCYTDYREMLEKEELDLVSVATPDHLHYEPTIAAIEAGINVLVEKPMATRLEEAEDIVRRARRRGVGLYVNFSNRFNPPFAALKERVERGELGEPLYAYVRLSDTIYVPTKMLSWASQTNVVFFLMSHTFDLVRWIFGSEAVSVEARAEFRVLKRLGIDTPDYVVALIEFEGGARAVLESSWILPESMPSIVDFHAEFIGTKGAAFIDTTYQMISVASERFCYPRVTTATLANRRFVGFVREMIHSIVDALLEGREPLVKPEDGLENVRALTAIMRSYERGGGRVAVR